jgi:hypothetical protein
MRSMLVLAPLAACIGVRPGHADQVDTEHMFGFSEGTDIGIPHQPEAELETVGRIGKSAGSFAAVTTTADLKYPVSDTFRIAPGIAFASYSVAGVPDFSDTSEFVLDQALLEFRWNPIAREAHPIGLTFVAIPFYGPIGPATGAGADNYGIEFIVAIDRTVIADRLYAAVNLLYMLDRARIWGSNVTTDSSLLKSHRHPDRSRAKRGEVEGPFLVSPDPKKVPPLRAEFIPSEVEGRSGRDDGK